MKLIGGALAYETPAGHTIAIGTFQSYGKDCTNAKTNTFVKISSRASWIKQIVGYEFAALNEACAPFRV
jgi:hypothetical protein